jgi:hypothetical protein
MTLLCTILSWSASDYFRLCSFNLLVNLIGWTPRVFWIVSIISSLGRHGNAKATNSQSGTSTRRPALWPEFHFFRSLACNLIGIWNTLPLRNVIKLHLTFPRSIPRLRHNIHWNCWPPRRSFIGSVGILVTCWLLHGSLYRDEHQE